MRNVLVIFAFPMVLSACGGGSNGDTVPTTPPTGTVPAPAPGGPTEKLVTYVGINFLQDIDAQLTYPATYTENGVNVAGKLVFGKTLIAVGATPSTDGSIAYTGPVIASNAISANSADVVLPAVAMLCESSIGTGTNGTSGQKSTDVLIASSAKRTLDVSSLVNQTLSFYREDCFQGCTNPPTTNANNLMFDPMGNLIVTTTGNSTVTLTASQFNAVLNGMPTPQNSSGSTASFMFYAYSCQRQDGSLGFAIVEHGTPALTNNTKGYVDDWTQQ